MSLRRCLNCRFIGGNRDQGYACRLRPPVIVDRGDPKVTSTAFPPVNPAWRCGAHRLRLWRVLTWWRSK